MLFNVVSSPSEPSRSSPVGSGNLYKGTASAGCIHVPETLHVPPPPSRDVGLTAPPGTVQGGTHRESQEPGCPTLSCPFQLGFHLKTFLFCLSSMPVSVENLAEPVQCLWTHRSGCSSNICLCCVLSGFVTCPPYLLPHQCLHF
jgi:hypothetical protein